MRIKHFVKQLLFIVVMMLFTMPLLAQGMPGDPGEDPDVKVPFDGGLSLLIAAGVGYGAKRAYDQRKKAQSATTTGDKQ